MRRRHTYSHVYRGAPVPADVDPNQIAALLRDDMIAPRNEAAQ